MMRAAGRGGFLGVWGMRGDSFWVFFGGGGGNDFVWYSNLRGWVLILFVRCFLWLYFVRIRKFQNLMMYLNLWSLMVCHCFRYCTRCCWTQ